MRASFPPGHCPKKLAYENVAQKYDTSGKVTGFFPIVIFCAHFAAFCTVRPAERSKDGFEAGILAGKSAVWR
jgi:hypothetical protein